MNRAVSRRVRAAARRLRHLLPEPGVECPGAGLRTGLPSRSPPASEAPCHRSRSRSSRRGLVAPLVRGRGRVAASSLVAGRAAGPAPARLGRSARSAPAPPRRRRSPVTAADARRRRRGRRRRARGSSSWPPDPAWRTRSRRPVATRADADLNAAAAQVNLARSSLTDGQQVVRARVGARRWPPASRHGGAAAAAAAGLVEPEHGHARGARGAPGIGPVTVQKIVAARAEQPFALARRAGRARGDRPRPARGHPGPGRRLAEAVAPAMAPLRCCRPRWRRSPSASSPPMPLTAGGDPRCRQLGGRAPAVARLLLRCGAAGHRCAGSPSAWRLGAWRGAGRRPCRSRAGQRRRAWSASDELSARRHRRRRPAAARDRAAGRARRRRRRRGRQDAQHCGRGSLCSWLPRGVDAGAGDRHARHGDARAARGLRRLRVSRLPGAAGDRPPSPAAARQRWSARRSGPVARRSHGAALDGCSAA